MCTGTNSWKHDYFRSCVKGNYGSYLEGVAWYYWYIMLLRFSFLLSFQFFPGCSCLAYLSFNCRLIFVIVGDYSPQIFELLHFTNWLIVNAKIDMCCFIFYNFLSTLSFNLCIVFAFVWLCMLYYIGIVLEDATTWWYHWGGKPWSAFSFGLSCWLYMCIWCSGMVRVYHHPLILSSFKIQIVVLDHLQVF
jgi:hypothetical protein